MGYLERVKELWRFTGWQMLFTGKGWTRMDLPAYIKPATERFQILTAKGMLTGEPGDVLVRWPDGDHTVISAATYAAIVSLASAPADAPQTQAQEMSNG